MRATLASGNLLTGAKYINIDYFPGVEPLQVTQWMEYTTIPTIGSGFDQIEVKVNELLDKFNQMPLESMVASANSALVELDKTLAGLRAIVEDQSTAELPAELNATLKSLRSTLHGLSPDSPFYQELHAALLQLNRTLSNVESMTRTLSTQPNAAIMPSTLPTDVIPEATR